MTIYRRDLNILCIASNKQLTSLWAATFSFPLKTAAPLSSTCSFCPSRSCLVCKIFRTNPPWDSLLRSCSGFTFSVSYWWLVSQRPRCSKKRATHVLLSRIMQFDLKFIIVILTHGFICNDIDDCSRQFFGSGILFWSRWGQASGRWSGEFSGHH